MQVLGSSKKLDWDGVDTMQIELQKLSVSDAQKWLELQIEAYMPLFEKYQDHETSPACETLDRIVERMGLSFLEHFFILKDDEIVGGVRTAWWPDTTRYRLGGIFILPQFQDFGIGQIAMNLVESCYPDATSWELDTLLQEKRNLHFYEKLGYRREGEEHVVNDRLTLVFYKKYLS